MAGNFHIHIGMYLLLTPSPYTKDEVLNYKSLDSYKNCSSGWVREVVVKTFDDKSDYWQGIVTIKY